MYKRRQVLNKELKVTFYRLEGQQEYHCKVRSFAQSKLALHRSGTPVVSYQVYLAVR